MSGAEFMADIMKAYGVTHIFFVPTILSHSLAQMDKKNTGISRVLPHGEKTKSLDTRKSKLEEILKTYEAYNVNNTTLQ